MSLRDALVSLGLVKKKDAARVNRELKDERRAEQGARRPQSEVEREEKARLAAAQEAEAAERLRERAEREAHREATERALRLENLLRDNALPTGRGQPFWHRAFGSDVIVRMEVSGPLAYQLRSGAAGIAARSRGADVDYVVLPKKAVLKLKDLAPERVVFFVEDTDGISAPELRFHSRSWETDLVPHRATDVDVELRRGTGTRGPKDGEPR